MKCESCGIDVPASYMKCPSCGKGFYGINTPSSFDISKQNLPDPNKVTSVGNIATNFNTQNVNSSNTTQIPNNIIIGSIGARFLAVFIDALICIIPAFFIGFSIGLWGALAREDEFMVLLKSQAITSLAILLYEAVFISSSWGATPGKRLMGLKVVNLNGDVISFWRSVGRSLSKTISGIIFFIGYIMAFFTNNKRALHDVMVGTIVIKG